MRGQDLFGLCRRLGLDRDESADAVQETILRLWRELRSGTEVLDLDAWSFRVAYRIAMDHHRFVRRLAEGCRRIAGSASARAAEAPDPYATIGLELLWRSVDRLPDRQRVAIYLRYRCDLSFDQVASVMHITPGAARSHATQAVATLRGMIGEEAR